MAEVKPTYIPQSTGMFFANAYLDSHRAKLEKSLAMAQAETQNQMALLEYYRKQEQAYLKYLAKIKGVKGFDDKTDSDLLKRQQAVLGMEQNVVDDQFRAAKDVRDRFKVPQSQTPLINSGAIDVANALSRGSGSGSAADRAIAASANTSGNEAAMASAITMYNAIKAADSRLATPKFDANEANIVQSLLNHFGLQGKEFGGKDAATYFTNQAGFEDLKLSQVKAAETKAGKRSISREDLLGQQTTSEQGTGGTGVDTTYEELMLSRIQSRAADLEDQIQKATRAEAIYERGKEIYNNQYGGNLIDRMGIRKRNKQTQARLDSMSPEKRFFVDSLEEANQIANNNPFTYREEQGLEGDNKLAADLLNAMIVNKGAAKPKNMKGFIEMAGKMATDTDGNINTAQQKRILGLALKGLNTFNVETDPAAFNDVRTRTAQFAAESEAFAQQERERAETLRRQQEEIKRQEQVAASPANPLETMVGTIVRKPYAGNKEYGYKLDGFDAQGNEIYRYMGLVQKGGEFTGEGTIIDPTQGDAKQKQSAQQQIEEAQKEFKAAAEKALQSQE